MSNVAIIYSRPNEMKDSRFGFSEHWALLGTVLHNVGHKVVLLDYSVERFDKNHFLALLQKELIQLIVIEFDSFTIKRSENDRHGNEIIRLVHEHYPNVKIVAYGHYCCITDKDVFNTDYTVKTNNLNDILFAVHDVLPECFQKFSFDSPDDVPFIDRQFLCEQVEFLNQNRKSTLICTAHGCENTCTFCHRQSFQSKYLSRSDESVLSEFAILQQQGFINVWITDDNFTFNLTRAKRILTALVEQKIIAEMKIAISSWMNIDEEFLDIAKRANIKIISFGIESSDEEILRFYKKKNNLEQVKRIVHYADSIGIFTVGNFIIGAPMETNETIENTFAFIRDCGFDQIHIKTLVYMQGSRIYENLPPNLKNTTFQFACKENGLNSFALNDLTVIKKKFLDRYYEERSITTKQKIEKYGIPFEKS
ncbi:MAG: radical SAM protein [Planctomycetaceae bacterium]|jgi:radical SAM superfamily enzyme YgiQ (UPF0313 family)|nr:radical SAM protein [Planctomycetaceae bacterium]